MIRVLTLMVFQRGRPGFLAGPFRRNGEKSRMRRTRRWAASCLVAALGAGPLASGGSPAVAAGDGTRGKVAGMSVTPATRPQQLSDIDLARIRATGINTVALDVWWDVDTNSSNSMHPGAITAPHHACTRTVPVDTAGQTRRALALARGKRTR